MTSPTPALQRAPFTSAQLAAAQEIVAGFPALLRDARSKRRVVRTHPIDNVAPEVLADRDDGIFVETRATQSGGYRVYVTIADVAGVISMKSPLARAIADRAHTRYRTEMTDPMLPAALEALLSLEHQQERLGMCVTMDLDTSFQLVHTECEPVITLPEATSYAQATTQMQTNPQFQLMAKIARGVREDFLGKSHDAVREAKETKPFPEHLTKEQMASMRMVETYMLLANYATAQLFAPTGLPFPYRNFVEEKTPAPTHDDAADKKRPVPRATYSTQNRGHEILSPMGPQVAYGHATSPIRRAPDFYVGKMIHYAVNVLSTAEKELRSQFPQVDQPALHHAVWQHASKILHDAQPGKFRAKLLATTLKTILGELGVAAHATRDLAPLCQQLQAVPLPFTKDELQADLSKINALNEAERRSLQAEAAATPDVETLRTQVLADCAKGFERYQESGFSSLLERAATCATIPESLAAETLARIRDGRINRVKDGLSLLVRIQHTTDERWLMLKRAMCQLIKNDPGAVNGIFEGIERDGALGPRFDCHILREQLPANLPQTRPTAYDPTICTAIGVLERTADGTQAATPFFSVGHDERSAETHAKYSFIEHLAFGQLVPLEQAAIPNLLYAELAAANRPKIDIVRSIAAGIGARVTVHTEAVEGAGYRCTVGIEGGELPETLIAHAIAPSADAAQKTAARRMLSNRLFLDITHHTTPVEISEAVFARESLENHARAHACQMDLHAETSKSGGRVVHHITVIITQPNGDQTSYCGDGPNIHRAANSACVLALKGEGWLAAQTQETQTYGAWVHDAPPIIVHADPVYGPLNAAGTVYD